YGYITESFMAWYSADHFEQYVFMNRATGPYAAAFWTLIVCNILVPQLLWFKNVRVNIPALFCISIAINIGMWCERYVIVVQSLHRDFLPAMWGMYYPTVWDWATFIGTIGFFIWCFLLFVRYLPMIPISEVQALVQQR